MGLIIIITIVIVITNIISITIDTFIYSSIHMCCKPKGVDGTGVIPTFFCSLGLFSLAVWLHSNFSSKSFSAVLFRVPLTLPLFRLPNGAYVSSGWDCNMNSTIIPLVRFLSNCRS